MIRDDNGLELTWEQQGNYPFPYTSIRLYLHGISLQQAWIDGKEVSCQGNFVEYSSTEGNIHPFQRVRLNTLLGKMTELI
ncbi:MAG TPA: hypothetical protein V6D50_16925 [Chroococcales cyanobacterium]|jgi:alpha-glucosidase